MKQPADSRLTGSACFRRRQLSPARRDRVPTQRPTAGWTPSRIGGKLRACRLPRSRGSLVGYRPVGVVVGIARAGFGIGGKQLHGDHSRRRCLRVRGAIAPQPRLYRLCPGHRSPWLVAFAERSRFFEVFSSSNGSGTSKFRVELNELPRDEWPARLRQLVAEQVSLILRRTVDPDRPLPEYGLDSLGALELRTRIETETGIRLAPKNVSATVRGLADHLYEQLAPDDAPAAALSSQ